MKLSKEQQKAKALELKQMQKYPLEIKIRKTQQRIHEFYEHFNGDVYVSFSGGKDSTVLLDIVRGLYPNVPAVFSDTGLEYPEVREFVKTIDNVIWVKPKKNFKQIIKDVGYPVISKEVAETIEYGRKNIAEGKNTLRVRQLYGLDKDKDGKPSQFNKEKWRFLLKAPFKISNKCCYHTKKSPIRRFETKEKLHPFIGTTTAESVQRKSQWVQFGCNAYDAQHPSSKPLSIWLENDILQYLKEKHVPYSTVYGDIMADPKTGNLKTTGADRTGCMFCMFGCHLEKQPNRFQRMKETHPNQYQYCMKPMDKGGLGLAEVLDYIGVKY